MWETIPRRRHRHGRQATSLHRKPRRKPTSPEEESQSRSKRPAGPDQAFVALSSRLCYNDNEFVQHAKGDGVIYMIIFVPNISWSQKRRW